MDTKEVDFFRNNVANSTAREEDIILAPPTELIDEAKTVAQNTKADEMFPFALQYDANQKEYLLFMLQTIGVILEDNDEEGHILSTIMNMTQLAFIKRLDCVERVKTDEGTNPFLADEAEITAPPQQDQQEIAAMTDEKSKVIVALGNKTLEPTSAQAIATAQTVEENSVLDDDITVTSVTSPARSSCSSCCPTNTGMETALIISDESYTSGYICCPGSEQWFRFTATRTGLYTICTTGSLDTIGTLYDCNGNQIVEVDDYAPCGKVNFRIIQNLTAGTTYYVKVRLYGNATGSYALRVTERVYANYVTINKNTITLVKGVTYELPVTPNYIYKGYNGAQRIPGLSVSITPSNTNEQKIWWYEQYGDILECSYGWDDDGDRYIHVTATNTGTVKLYAVDWNENGKRDECPVTVVTPYVKQLQTFGDFSIEEADLIQSLYLKVDAMFSFESTIVKAWKCARLLSEFSYDYNTSIAGISLNRWDDVAGSVTTQEDRQTYFINTLGYTESQYSKLNAALLRNHEDANNHHDIVDFTHMQYALAARLAYTLNEDGYWSNLGTGLYTGNFGIYTDEEISYLGGWFGDAILTNIYGVGQTVMKNDDYLADLDAENIYRLIIQGDSSLDASNAYYSIMTISNTRANMFLQNIPYDVVKGKIFYELIDADLYTFLSDASKQGNVVLVNYYLDLINNEQYHYDTIKSNYPDTYDFLKSLNDGCLSLAHYQ